ncbi:hypothetical protein [Saccharopolyspora sp. CA-218241]|uniref:hypothetical protein n=1 Tax=Saccharopolyspora sp. CA-218241 TaxID=3240027 RepID=UPI003D971217
MELGDVARDLYRADPGEFVRRRDARAAEAKERGEDRLARAIRKLRKPTTAAWAVDLLATDRDTPLERLSELGDRMRGAQRELDAERLRALTDERSRLLAELTEAAARRAADAGHPLGDAAREQVENTFTAALSDPDSARAVLAGTLDKPLEYSGFGIDELAAEAIRRGESERSERPVRRRGKRRARGGTEATASPPRRSTPAPSSTGRDEAAGRRDREAADRLEAAEQEVRRIDDERGQARRRRDELRAELAEVEQRLAELDEDATAAGRLRDRARRAVDRG